MKNEYIRKQDALVALMDNDLDHIQAPNGKEAIQILSDIPAADVAPVRHSKWVNGCCDKCGEHALYWSMASTYHASDFCPFCGAKMDREEREV